MKRKRISFVHLYMVPGGVERQLYYLVNGLANAYETYLVLCEGKGEFLDYVGSDVNLKVLGTKLKYRIQVAPLKKLLQHILRYKPDVLIAFHPRLHWLTVLAGKLTGTKVICSFPGYVQCGMLWRFHRFVYRQAGCLHAVSRGVKDSLCRNILIKESSVKVIENSVDCEALIALSNSRMNDQDIACLDSRNLFISMGRLVKGKGFELILSAVAGISEHFTLIIIGDGPQRDFLAAMIQELGLSERVFLLGKKVNPFKIFKKASFIILASESEGLPNVFLEAMCLDIPIMCTKYRGWEDDIMIHLENCFIVDPPSPQALRKAIEFFLSTESADIRTKLKSGGDQLLEEKFSLQQYISRFSEMIESFSVQKDRPENNVFK